MENKTNRKPALKKTILQMTFGLEKHVILYRHIIKLHIKLNCARLLQYCYDFSFDNMETEILLTLLKIYSDQSLI